MLCKDFKLENSQYALNLIVSDYLKLENRSIPSKFQIEFESIDQSVLNLDLIWDEIKLDPIHQVKFSIPDHYKKDEQIHPKIPSHKFPFTSTV